MVLEQNKAIVRRIHEELESGGHLGVADDVFAPTFASASHPDRPSGPEGVKRHIMMLRAAFPDLRVTVEDLIADGDRVAARLTMRATHQGSFHGIAPTGRQAIWTGLVIRRIQDGKVVEQWAAFDTGRLLATLTAPVP